MVCFLFDYSYTETRDHPINLESLTLYLKYKFTGSLGFWRTVTMGCSTYHFASKLKFETRPIFSYLVWEVCINTTCVNNDLKLLKLLHLTLVKHDLGWFRMEVLLKICCFILWSALWPPFQGCQFKFTENCTTTFPGPAFHVSEILDQNILLRGFHSLLFPLCIDHIISFVITIL